MKHIYHIETWEEHGEWVARCPYLRVHTFGATEVEALKKLPEAMAEQLADPPMWLKAVGTWPE